jgi:hypothetical protein
MNTTDLLAWIAGVVILIAVVINNFRNGTWKWRWDWDLALAVVWLAGRIIFLVVAAHFVIKYW